MTRWSKTIGYPNRVRAVALAYAGIGVAATFAPERVPAFFGGTAPSPASRTEIRAVYAGIPFAFAGLLGWASRNPDGNQGITRTVAAATGGMALARLSGAAAEKRLDPWPTGAFALMEVAMAAALLRCGAADH